MSIEKRYKEYSDDPLLWMEQHRCKTTKDITLKLMELAKEDATDDLNDEIQSLNSTIRDLRSDLDELQWDEVMEVEKMEEVFSLSSPATVYDQLKIELLVEAFKNNTLEQLQQILKQNVYNYDQ